MEHPIIRSIREALSGWWTIFGVLATTVTIFNLLNNTFHLNVPQVVALMLDGYRKVFHFPFRLVELFFSLSISEILKDAVVLWMIGSAATLRANQKTHNPHDFGTRFSLFRSVANAEWRHLVTYKNFRISIVLGFYHPIWRAILITVIWPRLLYLFFVFKPYLYKSKNPKSVDRHFVYAGTSEVERFKEESYEFLFDMRVVFVVQLLAALLAASALAYWSGLDTEAPMPQSQSYEHLFRQRT